MSTHLAIFREATPLRPRLEWREWPNVTPVLGLPMGPTLIRSAYIQPRPRRVQDKIDALMRKYADAGSTTPERVTSYRIAAALRDNHPDRRTISLPPRETVGGWFQRDYGIRYDVYQSGASSVVHAHGAVRFDYCTYGKEYSTACGRGSVPNRDGMRVTCLDCLAKKWAPSPIPLKIRIPCEP